VFKPAIIASSSFLVKGLSSETLIVLLISLERIEESLAASSPSLVNRITLWYCESSRPTEKIRSSQAFDQVHSQSFDIGSSVGGDKVFGLLAGNVKLAFSGIDFSPL